jgi:rhodanese-related sulfurtransferase
VAKLEFETDPSDVHAALARGAELVVVDVRSAAAWRQGRVRGAVHLPAGDIAARGGALLDQGRPVVVYCWGPGCNGATKAALALAELGFSAGEMIGGFEYWAREGLPVDTDRGDRHPRAGSAHRRVVHGRLRVLTDRRDLDGDGHSAGLLRCTGESEVVVNVALRASISRSCVG